MKYMKTFYKTRNIKWTWKKIITLKKTLVVAAGIGGPNIIRLSSAAAAAHTGINISKDMHPYGECVLVLL